MWQAKIQYAIVNIILFTAFGLWCGFAWGIQSTTECLQTHSRVHFLRNIIRIVEILKHGHTFFTSSLN